MRAVLQIIRQDYTGWVREQPKPQEFTVEVGEGELIPEVKSVFHTSAKLEMIGEDFVTLKTHGLSPKPGASINLRRNFDIEPGLILKIGESMRFATQTMDAGTTFTFKLVEIIEG